jgi:hypothetical protein
MCCFTHGADIRDVNNTPYPLASADVDDRCRCPSGGEEMRCDRRATAEDLMCDVCRTPPLPPVRNIKAWRRTEHEGITQWAEVSDWEFSTPRPPDIRTSVKYADDYWREKMKNNIYLGRELPLE